MASKELMRYAHSDGHVDLTFDDTGEHMVTCGSDGDIRVYKGFDDEDPVSHRVGDIAYAVAVKGSRFFVAADDNTVQSYMMEGGQPDRLIVRFTAHATHIALNKTETKLVAGASDFTVKLVDLESLGLRTITGHTAPVLSVSFHPNDSLLASSSCDGTVRVYRLDNLKEVKVISGLPKSNDFLTSRSLSRLAWDQTGDLLFVPLEKSVKVFDSKLWKELYELTDDSISQVVSIVCLSPCGNYMAAACRDGRIVIWEMRKRKVVLREMHDRGRPITSLCWNPLRNELAYADNMGYIGLLKNVVSATTMPPASATTSSASVRQLQSESVETESDLFDDADDDILCGAIPGIDADVDDADVDDKDGNAMKPLEQQLSNRRIIEDDDENTDRESLARFKEPAVAPVQSSVLKKGWEPAPLQQPFQPGSCPASLSTRFMVWNSVGIITQYSSEEEETIDVQFHDTSVHHTILIANVSGFTMADLSAEAVLLACEADGDSPSQLECRHFGSWDSCKEWTVSMPKGEDIMAICLGDGWLAAATDQRLVRLFTIGGLQRQIFRLPGPVVTMAAHMETLIVVYHSGLGISGDQCLSFRLLNISTKKTIFTDYLPLSAKSTLAWIGFSGEGSPFAVDSSGVVLIFNSGFGQTWAVVANLREHCKGSSDNYWVVGIRENPQQIRAIYCKGARYPATLPRPTIQLLPFQIPLCELTTDKGTFEENFLRQNIFSDHFNRWTAEGYEFDEAEKETALVLEQQLLMKQFALACKTRREVRAVEICRLMSTCRAVQLAIKYATQIGQIQVAHRLNELAQEKMQEEQQQLYSAAAAGPDRTSFPNWSEPITRTSSILKNRDSDEDDEIAEDKEEAGLDEGEDGDAENQRTGKGRLLLPVKRDNGDKGKTKSVSESQTSTSYKNPFKISSESSLKTITTTAKGTSVFDTMEKGSGKTSRVGSSSASKLGGRESKQASISTPNQMEPSKKGPSQPKLFGMTKAKNEGSLNKESKGNDKPVKPTGFQVWFDANRSSLIADAPDEAEDDLILRASKTFRKLTKDEQKEWQSKADGQAEKKTVRKRKQEDTETENLPDSEDLFGGDEENDGKQIHQSKKMKEEEKTIPKGLKKLTAFSFARS